MIWSVILAVGAIGCVTSVHLATMRVAYSFAQRSRFSLAARVWIIVYAAVVAHTIAAAIFAAAFWIGVDVFAIGTFEPKVERGPMEIFYFSLINMTTLGLGPIYPNGHIRLIAGIESLIGFLLISCSASFVFRTATSGNSKQNSPDV